MVAGGDGCAAGAATFEGAAFKGTLGTRSRQRHFSVETTIFCRSHGLSILEHTTYAPSCREPSFACGGLGWFAALPFIGAAPNLRPSRALDCTIQTDQPLRLLRHRDDSWWREALVVVAWRRRDWDGVVVRAAIVHWFSLHLMTGVAHPAARGGSWLQVLHAQRFLFLTRAAKSDLEVTPRGRGMDAILSYFAPSERQNFLRPASGAGGASGVRLRRSASGAVASGDGYLML